jgi:hypothetical protein
MSGSLLAGVKSGDFKSRPGWTRLNFNYFIDEETFEYTVKAVELIAEHAYKLVPYYEYDESSGTWNYLGKSISSPVSLDDLFENVEKTSAPAPVWNFKLLLEEGEQILNPQVEGKVTA